MEVRCGCKPHLPDGGNDVFVKFCFVVLGNKCLSTFYGKYDMDIELRIGIRHKFLCSSLYQKGEDTILASGGGALVHKRTVNIFSDFTINPNGREHSTPLECSPGHNPFL